MQSHTNLLFLAVLVCFAGLASVGFAQEAVSLAEKSASAADANEETVLSFPYIAEITTDNVNIRSGPGTNYYSCGKLNKADRVKLVGSQFSWSRIVPPAGSFSWISMQYVNVDPNNPASGIVTGDSVRVYAGSDNVQPIHSTSVQLKLNKGDKVRLMGEKKEDYHKIVPPAGAYLWVSSKYIKPLGPVGEFPLTIEPWTEPADTDAAAPAKISVEAKKLKEYYALKKQVQAERAKPIAQQNYANIKKAFFEIANNKEAGKAARYSEFAIKKIERFELALAVAKEIQLQDAQLQQIQERIDKARASRLAEVEDLGRFAVIGQFQTSNIYGPEPELKHYRVIDDSGRTVCYALPSGQASKMDLSKLIDRKVGLVGTIEPHPATGGALVRFTEIVGLREENKKYFKGQPPLLRFCPLPRLASGDAGASEAKRRGFLYAQLQ